MNNNVNFCELSDEELMEVNGGTIGTVCAVVGTVCAVITLIYGAGYAKGQNDGYRDKYGK